MDALRREDDVAKWRRKNGVARVDRVLRDSRFLPHPRNGGSRGYDIPFRQMIVDAYRAGNPAPEGMRSSVWRWTTNGVAPFRMTGNKPVSALSGQYLLLLVLIKLIWSQANYFECIAFIANQSDDAKVFSEGDVSLALRKLGYTMKVTSLPRSSHCDFTHLISSTAAAADRRARAAPDGGKFTAFPPRGATGTDGSSDGTGRSGRRGTLGGEWGGGLPLMARARTTSGRGVTGFVHGFCDYLCAPSSLLSPLLGRRQLKNGTGTCLRGFLR